MYSPAVCMCRPSKSLYRSRSRLFHMQIYVPRILLVEPGQGRSYANEFLRTTTIPGPADHEIYADVINRSRDHSFFIRSLQNPMLKMSRIARHVNTTQTAIMSAWHYCFIPPICSSRLYILITISKHDAWSPKVFLFNGNECHPAPCIPSSRNF